jgi:hypoxanthine phosphoribosyltransferase
MLIMRSTGGKRRKQIIDIALLKSQRELLGLTHDELAVLSVLSPGHFGRIERGTTIPSGKTAHAIDAALEEKWRKTPNICKNREYKSVLVTSGAISIPTVDAATEEMPWEQYQEAVSLLHDRIMNSRVRGGFRPHVVVGVNAGGAVVGGLLFFASHKSFRLVNVSFKENHQQSPCGALEDLRHLHDFDKYKKTRILLVDDSLKSGRTMRHALATVRDCFKDRDVEVKSAVIVYVKQFDELPDQPPDYFVYEDGYSRFPYCAV